ncbi:hypothetical protein [Leifsonia poae]|uniref:hypothetical protein n=1 Tax=Leifsonia poae TaxID=110933 RepID=UPI003D67A800
MTSLCRRSRSRVSRRADRSPGHLKEWVEQGDDVWSPGPEETDALAELVSQAG